MNEKELLELLDSFLAMDSENEVLEFKEANNDFDKNKIWKYFSALSNEANLKNKKNGWLIFWVKDSDHSICWTEYRNNSWLHKLKQEIWEQTTANITFQEIYEVQKDWKRVIMFQIPAAPRWIPIAWNWYYAARYNESTKPLDIEKIDRIRSQSWLEDFSIKICEWATIDDLDPEAIKVAREKFSQKNKDQIPEEEIKSWDDMTFLNKAKITVWWKITNTAIILLGKPESEHFLSPAITKISWILKDRDWIEIDYAHFWCPFLLSIEKIFNKIRNLKYRYLKEGSLFPDEVDKYEPYIIREAINNCIAHQDYTLAWKINVVENEDSLIFSNVWSFIPWNIEKVIQSDSPSEYYRNRFLADAMVNLKMIDTIWSWIKKMFTLQKNKLFPLPEYDFSDNKVTLTIIWKVLDPSYARKLILSKNDLSLQDIILLDKIQKWKELTVEQINYLRRKKYIEWRKPNFYISLNVVEWTSLVWDYILQQRNIEEQRSKILKFIWWYNKKWISKKEILDFVISNQILEQWLSEEQKENRVTNLIRDLKNTWKIYNEWSWTNWKWYKK